ncbi:MAG: sigma-54-dependent Fis family transcriptional regulator [Planctomycetota bacterium]|nr:MAG: sigma-54-dependent Fis family transcriptional regulator [Planctomycetota bacterium]REK28049.1 MAG: sigma-54-dependent Fis family transcriptional regulator [Planctomycetota bacterium]REK37576.1 MAG: sigma-54-dependent Fis family transcriptional regulator [Planctomycetota bacterium]
MTTPSDTTDDFLCHVFPGSSAEMRAFRLDIEKLNRYCQRYKGSIPCVLFTGESGVGKTFTARAISAHSQWLTLTDDERRELFYDDQGGIVFPAAQLIEQLLMKEHLPERGSKPRYVCRLATVLGPQLADDLAASELFGHKQHAFTGAQREHQGIFGDESVDDILLDEIADLIPAVQAKLLQFLETRTFRPVGGTAEDERVSAHRLFLATNRPLLEWVKQERFREDLYWRIQGHRIEIPPLRARKEVLEDLTRSILRSVNHRHRGHQKSGPSLNPKEDHFCLLPEDDWEGGKPHASNWVLVLTNEDLEWCARYDWPGNIRELRQRLELYVYRNGHQRLAEVLAPQRLLDFRPDEASSGDIASSINEIVAIYLQRVLDGDEPPPGQPNELIKFFENLVTSAVCAFKAEQRLKPPEIKRLFPNAKDPETTLGRWKSRCVR